MRGVFVNRPVWTPEWDSLLGTVSDMNLAKKMGLVPDKSGEGAVSRRRKKLGIQAFRTKIIIKMPCANCGKQIHRRLKDVRRSKKLFCSHQCASAGQKTRDSERLRYGPGWKNRRAAIRQRDKECRSCNKTPKENGQALHVHHLKPFRFGGSNGDENLVGLCDSCHHIIEIVTAQVLASIPIEISLDVSSLTIQVDGVIRWQGFVAGADALIPVTTTASKV
jgi:hypothetical protein